MLNNQFKQSLKVFIYSDWNGVKNIKVKTMLDNKVPAISVIIKIFEGCGNSFWKLIHQWSWKYHI